MIEKGSFLPIDIDDGLRFKSFHLAVDAFVCAVSFLQKGKIIDDKNEIVQIGMALRA